MSAMPGTMGLGLAEFVAMWALMMAAMMLPSVWPFVAVYERTIRAHRVARLGALAAGYLLAWALAGVVAFGVAWVFGELAAGRPGLARLGVMNLPALIAVAVIIAVEKVWRFGEAFARVVGVSALVYAALVGIEPSPAPGLDPAVVMNDDMEVDHDMDAPVPVRDDPMDMEPSEGP